MKYGLTRNYQELNEEEAKQMILDGKTDKEVSEHFGGGRLRRIAELRKSMGKKHKFVRQKTDPNILERIRFLAAQGVPVKDIANDIGKSLSWTRVLFNQLDLKKEKELRIKSQLEELFAQGKSVKDAAEILKKSINTIYNYKKKFKL